MSEKEELNEEELNEEELNEEELNEEELNEEELDAVAGGRNIRVGYTPRADKLQMPVVCEECCHEMIISAGTEPARIRCEKCKGKVKMSMTL